MRDFIVDNGPYIVILLLVAVLIGIIVALEIRSARDIPKLYAAWMKLHPDAKLTFEEWKVLYKHDFFTNGSSGFATGMAVGVAAGAVATAGRR